MIFIYRQVLHLSEQLFHSIQVILAFGGQIQQEDFSLGCERAAQQPHAFELGLCAFFVVKHQQGQCVLFHQPGITCLVGVGL